MTVEDSLKGGDLQACREDLQRQLRKNPGDIRRRISVFELFVIMGVWDKAMVQLSVLSDLAPDAEPMVQTYRQLLRCESMRQEVFQAVRTPCVLGEPKPWIAQVVQALSAARDGDVAVGMIHLKNALAAAPQSSGFINGHHFDWIGDSDGRLGPIIEAIIDGRYFWVPFDRVTKITLESPADLRDLVWLPATFTWTNGGQSVGFIPTRYPGSELSTDGDIRLGRKTIWQAEDILTMALGQRVLATDQDDYPLMDIRAVEFARDSELEQVETIHG